MTRVVPSAMSVHNFGSCTFAWMLRRAFPAHGHDVSCWTRLCNCFVTSSTLVSSTCAFYKDNQLCWTWSCYRVVDRAIFLCGSLTCRYTETQFDALATQRLLLDPEVVFPCKHVSTGGLDQHEHRKRLSWFWKYSPRSSNEEYVLVMELMWQNHILAWPTWRFEDDISSSQPVSVYWDRRLVKLDIKWYLSQCLSQSSWRCLCCSSLCSCLWSVMGDAALDANVFNDQLRLFGLSQ